MQVSLPAKMSYNMPTIHPTRILFPNADFVTSSEVFFTEVKEHFPTFRDHGFFMDSEKPVLCVYKAANDHEEHFGVFGAISLDDVEKGDVIGHEDTLAEKEQIMLQLIMEREALIKPVLLTYHDEGGLVKSLKNIAAASSPSYQFSYNNYSHAIWIVDQKDVIQNIQEHLLSEAAKFYIADGHHRTSTSLIIRNRFKKLYKNEPDKLIPYEQLFCAVFPMSQLDIHDFNRKVAGLNGLSDIAFIAALSNLFTIKKLKAGRKPKKRHEITMFIKGEWFSLAWRKSIIDSLPSRGASRLDVAMLNKMVLQDIIGIEDVRTDKRVTYIEGTAGIAPLESPAEFGDEFVSFCLYPVSFQQFIEISDTDEVLPPKSTWFVPRIHNGLVVMPYAT